MEDEKIIELYWSRAESAVSETAKKYGKYCFCIAHNILHSIEDADECVNDTYVNVWNAIPPNRPNRLSTFLGKITRNLSLQRYRKYTAEKRGGGQMELVLSEMEDCIPAASDAEQFSNDMVLNEAFNKFLKALPQTERIVFVRRYWYISPIKDIAKQSGMGESKVKSMLFRTRNKLKKYLESEGILV